MTLNLHGAALVQAVKGLIMSTANPQLDVNSDNSAIVSPRRQGAGQINAGAATSSQFILLPMMELVHLAYTIFKIQLIST